ncbi:MAG: hypothetical protein IKS42_03440 [Oscillospiraceae bacterium]|nr:hypothetical protein [Oscillospiraceae bacterium]
MPEQEKEQLGESGIFERKEFQPADLPLSGKQKSERLIAAIFVLIACVCVYLVLKDPFMKPVRTFYKGMSRQSAAGMCEAFPAWLIQKTDDTGQSVYETCGAVIAAGQLSYGMQADYKASLRTKTPVEQERLDKIASGIKTAYGMDVKVTKGYTLSVSVRIKSSGEPVSLTQYIRVYKINGRWVMIDVPSDTE